MGAEEYANIRVEVLRFDAAARKRPSMYFGVGHGDPRLPTRVVEAVTGHAVHPATALAEEHTLTVRVDVLEDLVFAVEHDLPCPAGPSEQAFPLGGAWWSYQAAAGLSRLVRVEVWADGLGVSRDFTGLDPVTPPAAFDAAGAGTRVTYWLDESLLGAEAAVTTDLAGLRVCEARCAGAPPPKLTARDHRA